MIQSIFHEAKSKGPLYALFLNRRSGNNHGGRFVGKHIVSGNNGDAIETYGHIREIRLDFVSATTDGFAFAINGDIVSIQLVIVPELTVTKNARHLVILNPR